MRSLLKISRRYILTAILVTVLVLCVNGAAFLFLEYQLFEKGESFHVGQSELDEIEAQMTCRDGSYELSEEGYRLLEESSYVWAMRLNEAGEVVWSYELPEEVPRHYTVADAASFGRWYIGEYPVFIWRSGEELMVYGAAPDQVLRSNVYVSMDWVRRIPDIAGSFLIVNMIFIVGLALLLGWRFYRSLRPIADGIERLEEKRPVDIPEKGAVRELSQRLNRASVILKEQDELLTRRDDARTEWIAGVSHDIRTPLSLITGYSDELAAEPSLGEEERKKAEIIRGQSLIIGQLIADLNLTSKLAYHSQPLKKELISPAVLLRECVAGYYNQGLGEEYEIGLSVEAAAEQGRLFGDPGLLTRAFRNLIGNSIRHNPDGCQINVDLRQEKGGMRILFTDSGEGIGPRIVHRMEREARGEQPEAWDSERLARVQRGETAAPVHIMGLRIVGQIAAAHGGRLEFVRRISGNCDVRLVLPLEEPKAPPKRGTKNYV